MDEIVIGHRAAPRILAVLPLVVVVLAARVLTVFHAAVPVRALAAGVVAVSCWWAYRLLTACVVVGEAGVHVRGVMYEADIAFSELGGVDVVPAGKSWQLLLLGIMRPHALALRAGSRTLHPVGAVSTDDDEDVERAVRTIRARSAGWLIPAQRRPEESVTSV